ncbi:MAG TPA: CoA-binding protein [Capsulimonadaceae bacterium]|nr:CoA-binding protein [Capsulimonadaceae bacterium]
MQELIERILLCKTFAVVGVSRDPQKYGYLVYHSLKESDKTVYAVNPRAEMVDGDPCYESLEKCPQVPEAAVFVVPPAVSEETVLDCARLGIGLIWMQEGAESDEAVRRCGEAGIGVVYDGPCIMVALRTHGLWKHAASG